MMSLCLLWSCKQLLSYPLVSNLSNLSDSLDSHLPLVWGWCLCPVWENRQFPQEKSCITIGTPKGRTKDDREGGVVWLLK